MVTKMRRAKKKYRVINGTHAPNPGKNPHLLRKGDVIESDRALDKIFRNKFEEVPPETPVTPTPSADEVEDETTVVDLETGDGGTDDEEKANTDTDQSLTSGDTLGENVTSQFSKAEAVGALVFKSGNAYQVASADSPETPMNKKALRSKAKVNEFLEGLADE